MHACVQLANLIFLIRKSLHLTELAVRSVLKRRLLCDSDDIVYTSLNPPQTFRTTILAGMNPMIVQDICGRALGFWTYQVTQEIRLQETVLKETKEVRCCMPTASHGLKTEV